MKRSSPAETPGPNNSEASRPVKRQTSDRGLLDSVDSTTAAAGVSGGTANLEPRIQPTGGFSSTSAFPGDATAAVGGAPVIKTMKRRIQPTAVPTFSAGSAPASAAREGPPSPSRDAYPPVPTAAIPGRAQQIPVKASPPKIRKRFLPEHQSSPRSEAGHSLVDKDSTPWVLAPQLQASIKDVAATKPQGRQVAPMPLSAGKSVAKDTGVANRLTTAAKASQPSATPLEPSIALASKAPTPGTGTASGATKPARRRIVPEPIGPLPVPTERPSNTQHPAAPDQVQLPTSTQIAVKPRNPTDTGTAAARGNQSNTAPATETAADWDPQAGSARSGASGASAAPSVRQKLAGASPMLQALAKGRGGSLYGTHLQLTSRVGASWQGPWRQDGAGTSQTKEFLLTVTPGGEVECSVAGGAPIWKDHLLALACCACGSSEFSAVAVVGGTLHVYHPSGYRCLPPLRLGREIVSLHATGKTCIVATEAKVWVWDMSAPLARTRPADMPRSLPAGEHLCADMPNMLCTTVRSCRLAASGLPLVEMDNGEVLLWHRELSCWVVVADGEAGLPDSLYRRMPFPPGLAGRGELAEVLESSMLCRGVKPCTDPVDLTAATFLSFAAVTQSATQLQLNATAAQLLVSQTSKSSESEAWIKEYHRFASACTSLPWALPSGP
mmetsp:Transcript_5606/g.15674  ORF Transcript_5606/g.15674 Transcript_5606/m.15674 type:complete len:668 (+) Transcript_5606:2036-4039(+)